MGSAEKYIEEGKWLEQLKLEQREQQKIREQQVGGDHYKKHKIQPWDIIDEYNLNFYKGNIIKYILRKKSGLEDLKKARHYIDKLISSYND